MCTTAKYCLLAFLVAVVLTIFLWYRNWTCDRLLAVVILGLGVLQLFSYACHSSMKSSITGSLIAFTIWIILLAYIFTIYVYTDSWIAGFATILTIIALIYVVYGILSSTHRYKAYAYPGRSIPTWVSLDAAGEEQGMLGYMVWPFLLVLIVGWFVMIHYQGWTSLSLYLLAVFAVVCALLVPVSYQSHHFAPYWSYLLVGLGLVIFLIGSFYPPEPRVDSGPSLKL